MHNYLSVAIVITAANILGKLLGFLRDIAISFYYGSNALTDCFFLAMSIPYMVLGVFTSSTDSAIIPQYNRIRVTHSRQQADRYFSKIITTISVVGIVVSILIWFFSTQFIIFIAPNFNQYQIETTERFLRWFAFLGFLHIQFCFYCTYNTIFNSIGARAILSFSTNLIVIIVLYVKHDAQMLSLMYAYIFSSIVSAIVPMYIAYKIGFIYNISYALPQGETKHFLKVFIPIACVAMLNDLNLFVDKFLATRLPEGSLSALNYASKLPAVFDNMIVVGMGIYVLSSLSELYRFNEKEKFCEHAMSTIYHLLIILLPVSLLFIIFDSELIEVIFMRGKFDLNSVNLVSKVLQGYAPLVVLSPLYMAFSRIFHSTEDTKTPMLVYASAVIVNIIFSVALSLRYGVVGIAAATSIAQLYACLLLLLIFKFKFGYQHKNIFLKYNPKLILYNVAYITFLIYLHKCNIYGLYKLIYSTIGIVIYYLLVYSRLIIHNLGRQ